MELTAKQAREMRREENRRAWARRQARFDREAEKHQREGREEKRAARAANRERWWMEKHGCHAPGQPPVDELPEGWHFMSGTLTQPNGWLWASNRKSIRSGERKTALVRDPAYK